MYQHERIDEILKILKENHYATVDYLVKQIRYSPASIRRDLTVLEKQGLVTRSYGGVTYKDPNVSPYRFRQHSMKLAKNAIAKRAASLVKNGDVIFIDGSSTTQYMGRYLTKKNGITVVTCNMILADFLSEHGVKTYCTGGMVVEHPGILGGPMATLMLSKFNFDISFFSSTAFDPRGKVLSLSERGAANIQCYREHSKKISYLCGSDKLGAEASFVSLTLDKVDFFISDAEIPSRLKEKYKTTHFLCTNL